MAIRHPRRVLTFTSFMSTLGGNDLVQPSLKAKLLFLKKPQSESPEDVAKHRLWLVKNIAGKVPVDDAAFLQESLRIAQRSVYLKGTESQAGAKMRAEGRATALSQCTVPALVLHGAEDILVPLENGVRTVKALCRAKLVVFPNMGHYLLPQDFESVADEIVHHCRRHQKQATISSS
jgi:proline iminopeptidase